MGPTDTSKMAELDETRAQQHLLFTKEQLDTFASRHADDVQAHVPGFEYWALDESRKMNRSPNICGYQQRAFDFYWSLRSLQRGRIMLGVGCGGVGAPNQFTTDRFNGTPPPSTKNRYGTGSYGYSCQAMNADEAPWPYFNSVFGGVMMNHSFEHFINQQSVLSEALRVTENEGFVCVIMPDMTYNGRGCIDDTHTREFSADEFYTWLKDIEKELPAFTILEHNTFDNAFSFNTVLVRR